MYSASWLANRAPGTIDAIKKNIITAALKGTIGLFVDINGISEDDKGRLSAYRVIADQIGYEIGKWKYNKKSGTQSAIAPIRKKNLIPGVNI